jgi:hypothetical protein
MLSGWIGWDDGLAAAFGQPVTELAGVIGSVGDQLPGCGNTPEEFRHADQVVDLARCEAQGYRSADMVGYGMNFGRPSAARSADGVFEVPPFAPAAERWALMWVESTAVVPITPLEPLRA